MACAAWAMAKALQDSIADQTSNVLGFDSAGKAPTASIQRSRIDIGNGDGIRVQNEGVPARERRQPMVSTPRVTYIESEDEYGEDEDAEWQGRSPLYPAGSRYALPMRRLTRRLGVRRLVAARSQELCSQQPA